jgi:PIN domain nuclease of toxin-antitoxin system
VIHVVDTHALLWHIEGSASLSRRARQVLADATDSLIVPVIVVAEARYAIEKQRTTVTWQDLLNRLETDNRFRVEALDLDLLQRAPTQLEMHDAFIRATALIYQEAVGESVPVITRDRRIRDSGLVQTVW